MSTELFKLMAQSIVDGDADIAVELANQAIAAGLDPLEAITKGYVMGVTQVGEAFSSGDAFLPELVISPWISIPTVMSLAAAASAN